MSLLTEVSYIPTESACHLKKQKKKKAFQIGIEPTTFDVSETIGCSRHLANRK